MKTLGLIAEDQSDVEVIHEIARKISRKKFALKRFVGQGCGKIHSKCRAWSEQLRRQGCSVLIIVCDLDRHALPDLSNRLNVALAPSPIAKHVIVIPVREIEAWLLADHAAITQALKLRKPLGKQANPESILNPKERLRDLVQERSGGRVAYLNTVHNLKIARRAQVANLARCLSFVKMEKFLRENLS